MKLVSCSRKKSLFYALKELPCKGVTGGQPMLIVLVRYFKGVTLWFLGEVVTNYVGE